MCAWVCFIWPTESHMTPRPVVALYTCIPTDHQCDMHDVEIKGMCWWDKRLDGTAVDAAFRVLGLELAVYCMHRALCAYLHACMYTYYKDISRRVLLAWQTAVPRRLQLCAYVYACDLVNYMCIYIIIMCMYIILCNNCSMCAHWNGTSCKRLCFMHLFCVMDVNTVIWWGCKAVRVQYSYICWIQLSVWPAGTIIPCTDSHVRV